MHNSFIKQTINLLTKQKIDDFLLILPSKRAIVFFKEELKLNKSNYIFPEIITFEDLLFKVVKKNKIQKNDLLLEFYQIYLNTSQEKDKQEYKNFISWAKTALNDFNELDLNLIESDTKSFLNYLADINRIEKWNLENSTNKISNNYFSFLQKLTLHYEKIHSLLKSKKLVTKGLLYKNAYSKIDEYIKGNRLKHIFIGFNGLNKIETKLIEKLLQVNSASVIFDVDSFFYRNIKSYGYFINKLTKKWNNYSENVILINSNFENNKPVINYYNTAKDISQSKIVGELIKSNTISNNALIVLGNEKLINPIIHTIPKSCNHINITMGMSLNNNEIVNSIHLLFKILIKKDNTLHHKELFNLLKSELISDLIINDELLNQFIKNTTRNNLNKIYDLSNIKFLFKKDIYQLIKTLLSNKNDLEEFILNIIKLLDLSKHSNNEVVSIIKSVFLEIKNIINKHTFINDIETIYLLFNELINKENLNFKGDPFNGIQIMGLLETRLLDYDDVVIVSCNEGFLPTNTNNSSFIPFDLKIEHHIPTFKDKDAIFSYHFFRVIQRAKHIHLIYNTETDSFGSGEKSRFIKQLELITKNSKNINVNHINVQSSNKLLEQKKLTINKTKEIFEKLNNEAKKGFSPSTLLNYINNPIGFYKQKIAKIKELETVEEYIAPNTFGNILHQSFEKEYTPFINKVLNIENIKTIQKNINKTILNFFNKEFKNGDFKTGKNRLMFEVAKEQAKLFLKKELQLVKNNTVKIVGLEKEIETTIKVDFHPYIIKIKGNVDRIDYVNDTLRIIDYKTGKVEQKSLFIKDWNKLISDYDKHAKNFQLLMYAHIYTKINNLNAESQKIETGIISFKNINAGFMKFNKTTIDQKTLSNFEEQLHTLLKEIFNPKIPFIQNENAKF